MTQQRTTLILSVIFIVFIATYWLWVKDKKTTSLDSSESQFAISDTSAISEVELVKLQNDKERGRIILKRTGKGQWTVNNQYKAQTSMIQTLLTTLFRLEVREPVHPNAHQTVFETIKRSHIHLKITTNNETYRYYIGGTAADGSGTIMLKEGADQPFVLEIPGFHGYLTSRFPTEIDAWRENLLFDISPETITQVSIKSPSADSSFNLVKAPNGWIINGQPTDSTAVIAYLDRFTPTFGERFMNSFCPNCLDSLKTIKPNYLIDIQTTNNKNTQLKLYEQEQEVNSFLGVVSNSNEVRSVQKFVIQRYFVVPDFFKKQQPPSRPI
ncbi:MAG: DUF4340 domain-containing protein [Bacteroidia bacterium]|nr:DUF4340 domain-containing protein [Bacteroidia bacterium]